MTNKTHNRSRRILGAVAACVALGATVAPAGAQLKGLDYEEFVKPVLELRITSTVLEETLVAERILVGEDAIEDTVVSDWQPPAYDD